MKFAQRSGMGHILFALGIIVIILFFGWLIAGWYSNYEQTHNYVSGTFEGYSTVNPWNGDQYIIRLSTATVTCNSWQMGSNDVYTLTHAQNGQQISMTLACTNVVVS